VCGGHCSVIDSHEESIMSNLGHWNPFNTLLRVHPNVDVEGYLRGFGPQVVWTDIEAATPSIRLNVSEDDEMYRIAADIPGATREDIELGVDGNIVSICAEIKRESKHKENEKEICSERRVGKISRRFAVAVDVDGAKAQAVYENGVLTIRLPKKSHGQAHRISID
jgi:HSP20 family protein